MEASPDAEASFDNGLRATTDTPPPDIAEVVHNDEITNVDGDDGSGGSAQNSLIASRRGSGAGSRSEEDKSGATQILVRKHDNATDEDNLSSTKTKEAESEEDQYSSDDVTEMST